MRESKGGIPIGFKIAGCHIEKDMQLALDVGAEYIILEGRGGGTGSAPKILRNYINIPPYRLWREHENPWTRYMKRMQSS